MHQTKVGTDSVREATTERSHVKPSTALLQGVAKMRALAAILALVLLAAPISGVAVAENTGMQRAIAHQKMLDEQNQWGEFWKKFDASMAKIDRDLPGPRGMSEEGRSPYRAK